MYYYVKLLKIKKAELERIAGSGYFRNPQKMIDDTKDKLNNIYDRYKNCIDRRLSEAVNNVDSARQRLMSLNPDNVLKRGYSIVYSEDGHVITGSENVNKGNKLRVLTSNGEFNAVVD